MNISYKWLSDYLPQKISKEELRALLTQIGLEVEEVEPFSSIKGGLEKVVIGRIEKIEPIPNAEKIRLAYVCIDENLPPLQIVCGAKNIREKALVVVALEGAKLYPIGEPPFSIKKVKMRGIESCGMICSEKEIGLGENNEGVMLIDREAPAGTKASDFFNVYTDTIFKINILPNRSDAMSHYGVARDVCAYLSYHQNKIITPLKPAVKELNVRSTPQDLKVFIEDTEACKRYDTLKVENIRLRPSVPFIKNRLLSIGQQPINNVVDITNYILHDIGQPLHVFDAAAIAGNTIVVKKGIESVFVALDGKERKLSKDDLLICNERDPMCIAGVLGGAHSGARASTNAVVFESAYFEAESIRKTSLRYQLRTEAALRFEKKIDIEQTAFALKRAAYLLSAYLDINVENDIYDEYPQKEKNKKIRFSFRKIEQIAGKKYEAERVACLLKSLQFKIIEQSDDEWEVEIPSFKSDIAHAADMAEEVMRIDGLQSIPMSSGASIVYKYEKTPTAHEWENRIAQTLCGMGFYESIHNSIVSDKLYADREDAAEAVALLNNVSADHNTMRLSMVEPGLESVARNINHKRGGIKLFEFGKIYKKRTSDSYAEFNKLALWISGDWESAGWQNPKGTPSSYAHALGIIESLAELHALRAESALRATNKQGFAQGAAFFYRDKEWAFVGQVHPRALRVLDIKQDVWYAEVDMEFALLRAQENKIVYREISKFHDVKRDAAFFIDAAFGYQEIKTAIESLRIPFLSSIYLFDVFKPKEKDKDVWSLAIRFSFQNPEKTLTDAEVNASLEKIIRLLEKKFNASIRKS